jgi:hypothetical protein
MHLSLHFPSSFSKMGHFLWFIFDDVVVGGGVKTIPEE